MLHLLENSRKNGEQNLFPVKKINIMQKTIDDFRDGKCISSMTPRRAELATYDK